PLLCIVRLAAPACRRSFPTRRSSDLGPSAATSCAGASTASPASIGADADRVVAAAATAAAATGAAAWVSVAAAGSCSATRGFGRSEEHTSELQSRENLVCRLLLEKKK